METIWDMRVWIDTRRQYNLKSEMWTEHLCTFSSLISVDCFPLWAQKLWFFVKSLTSEREQEKKHISMYVFVLCC